MQVALVIGQAIVVIFLAFHDWVPLGRLNDLAGLRTVDTTTRLLLVTTLSTLPFAAVLAACIIFLTVDWPNWLLWWLWGTYLTCAYGILRAWWIPYLVTADSVRANRYSIRFANTHSFLPERNGIKPDTLHVAFHSLIVAILALLLVLTSARKSTAGWLVNEERSAHSDLAFERPRAVSFGQGGVRLTTWIKWLR